MDFLSVSEFDENYNCHNNTNNSKYFPSSPQYFLTKNNASQNKVIPSQFIPTSFSFPLSEHDSNMLWSLISNPPPPPPLPPSDLPSLSPLPTTDSAPLPPLLSTDPAPLPPIDPALLLPQTFCRQRSICDISLDGSKSLDISNNFQVSAKGDVSSLPRLGSTSSLVAKPIDSALSSKQSKPSMNSDVSVNVIRNNDRDTSLPEKSIAPKEVSKKAVTAKRKFVNKQSLMIPEKPVSGVKPNRTICMLKSSYKADATEQLIYSHRYIGLPPKSQDPRRLEHRKILKNCLHTAQVVRGDFDFEKDFIEKQYPGVTFGPGKRVFPQTVQDIRQTLFCSGCKIRPNMDYCLACFEMRFAYSPVDLQKPHTLEKRIVQSHCTSGEQPPAKKTKYVH